MRAGGNLSKLEALRDNACGWPRSKVRVDEGLHFLDDDRYELLWNFGRQSIFRHGSSMMFVILGYCGKGRSVLFWNVWNESPRYDGVHYYCREDCDGRQLIICVAVSSFRHRWKFSRMFTVLVILAKMRAGVMLERR